MILQKSELEQNNIEIDLTGPDGNAFVLLSIAKKLSKSLGYDWNEVKENMTSGDYENLVSTMDEYFGSVVTMYR